MFNFDAKAGTARAKPKRETARAATPFLKRNYESATQAQRRLSAEITGVRLLGAWEISSSDSSASSSEESASAEESSAASSTTSGQKVEVVKEKQRSLIVRLQSIWRGRLSRIRARKMAERRERRREREAAVAQAAQLEDDRRQHAAVRIQTVWRGRHGQQQVQKLRHRRGASKFAGLGLAAAVHAAHAEKADLARLDQGMQSLQEQRELRRLEFAVLEKHLEQQKPPKYSTDSAESEQAQDVMRRVKQCMPQLYTGDTMAFKTDKGMYYRKCESADLGAKLSQLRVPEHPLRYGSHRASTTDTDLRGYQKWRDAPVRKPRYG